MGQFHWAGSHPLLFSEDENQRTFQGRFSSKFKLEKSLKIARILLLKHYNLFTIKDRGCLKGRNC
jgi:hypothetical protein